MSWNRAQVIKFEGQELNPPPSVLHCPGNGAVHDIQLAQMNLDEIKFLSEPVPIFKYAFTFCKISPLKSLYISLFS